MKSKKSGKISIIKILFLVFLGITLFLSGFILGSIIISENEPVILTWIDSKYGLKFYGVHISAKKEGNSYGVYCRILISPNTGSTKYYHDIGKIGTENSLNDITEKYSDIRVVTIDNKKFLYIGSVNIISLSELENHR